MMLINGEKWACEACVRGHRVSNCQHSDRKLQHINKKGRPVSQCQHCRSMRKSRSSHIKCDCGEKSSKCPHLKTTVDGHKDSCCCNHGGRCTCSHKREPLTLDPVPEADSALDASLQLKSKASSRSRRRANTATSEGLLSFDTNGHHKPTYKHTKASQKSGPYQIPRTSSMHSSNDAGAHSVDNLMHAGNGSDSQGSGSPDSTGCVNSEATSPLMTGSSSFAQLNGQLPPLDLSNIKFPPYVPNSAEFFERISDHDQPIFSAGLSAASVDWSNYEGLEFASKADFAPSSYSQPQSYSGYDYGAEQVPTLTTNTSTSGEVSEAEDILSNPLELEDFDAHYRNNTTLGLTHTGLLTNTDLSAFDLDESRFTKAGNKYLATSSSLPGDDSTLLAGASGYGVFASFEDEQSYWMQDFSGLPNCALTESPTTDAPYMYQWDNQ